ncbi:hypothetical protein C8D77_11390 [Mesorhizobium loti]|uniref:Uncharacterized protein n=1 Tax=Rhizobium loti TaxID=381 RepID=A0A8E2W811_RHILI|nr:hypothetical protein C8D77_11390 [Mesorhizobium loti]
MPKLAFHTIEWRSSGFSKHFRVPDGATSARAGSYPERLQPSGSTAGWRKRRRCEYLMTIVRDEMPSPSSQSQAGIWTSRTTCASARPIRGLCLKNCALSRGRVGTMNCGPGEFHSAHMRLSGHDGQASNGLPSMPNRRKENGDVRPPETPKPVEPHNSGLVNAGATATRCQLRIYLPWAAPSPPSSTGLSSSANLPVNSLSCQTQPPSIPTPCLQVVTSFGVTGVRQPWPNL